MTMHPKIIQSGYDYPTAFSSWGREEYEAINRVVASGRFTMGAEVEAFEAEFAAYHWRQHCIMVNSGSSANLIALAAQKIDAGAPWSVPSLAWATTYAPLMQSRVPMRLVDCDDTWNCPSVSIGVPVLGNPTYSPEAYRIEDCCESVGARNNEGVLCGKFGLFSTFSFFYSHQLSAIEGGAILTDSDHYARMCRALRNHGWTRGLCDASSFAREYEFIMPGYNVRPIEMHAAIARAQLRKLDNMASERRINWRLFAAGTNGMDIQLQKITAPDGFNPFCIAFTVPSEEIREKLAAAFRANGIDCRPAIGGSFRLQPYGRDYQGPETPNADRIHRTGMMLGCAPFDIEAKLGKAIKVMKGIV